MAEEDVQAHDRLASEAAARGERAARRAAEAHQRAGQLQRYREAVLTGGDPAPVVDEASLAGARAHARESAERAAGAHEDAALAHDMAAATHEQAARQRPEQARTHREEAQRHRAEARKARRMAAVEPDR